MKRNLNIMHPSIEASALASLYQIKPVTDNEELAKYLGQKVRYKKNLLTRKFIKRHGTICIGTVFEIREVQHNYKREECLRGYAPGDNFGRVIYPSEVEIVDV